MTKVTKKSNIIKEDQTGFDREIEALLTEKRRLLFETIRLCKRLKKSDGDEYDLTIKKTIDELEKEIPGSVPLDLIPPVVKPGESYMVVSHQS